jgi:hypothetical protein
MDGDAEDQGGVSLESGASAVGEGGPISSNDQTSDTTGGMSSVGGVSAPGDDGPNSSVGPAGDGGGGMSSAAGTSTAGDPGPTGSIGPTAAEQAYHAGYQQGAQDQYTSDHESLGHEDPVGAVAEGAAHGVGGIFGAVISGIHGLMDESHGADAGGVPDGPETGGVPEGPWEGDPGVPDATLSETGADGGIEGGAAPDADAGANDAGGFDGM